VQQGEETVTPAAHPSITHIRAKDWLGEQKTYSLLTNKNWQSWKDNIVLMFKVCRLHGYIHGDLKCPDITDDPEGADNWKYNNNYTKKVIWDCLSDRQKYHIVNCKTAHKMWSNLEAIHQSCEDITENQLM
jgi:hypothetical protein